MTKKRSWLLGTGMLFGILMPLVLQPLAVFAADGSGTNTVSPTTATASSTGNTYTFTFTAAEAMDSGSITLTIPSGWSAPQGTPGTAGYTTVSSTGTTGTIIDAADSLTGWNTGNACAGSFTLETTNKHSGTGAVKCVNSNDKVHDVFYKTISAQNWSSYTTIGFWIYSNVGVNNGDLKFDYDDTAALVSPIESLSLGRSVAANTWTYVSFPFVLAGATRSSIVSFGLEIANASNMKNATVIVDNFFAGPASGPTFNGQTITVNALTLAAGQTVTITYGDGGGTSGATAPAASGTYTFTTKTRTSDSGTLTDILVQPTVVISNPVPTTTSISPTTKTAGQAQFTLTVNGANFISGSTVQLDGSNRTTTYVSATQLTATVLAADIAAAGTHNITVVNSAPGGGTSNAQTLTVVNPPSVSGVSSSTADGSYTTGQVIPIQVTFSRAVTVTGTPQLTLSTGSPSTTTLNYAAGSGSTTLAFNYTVASGNTTSDLDYASTSALALNSGTITDSTTGANATLMLASPGATNSLGANKAIVIDTAAPTVSGVTSSTANGTYPVGQVIPIQVNFSEAVTVTGTPRLTISTGSPTTTALDYSSGSGTSTLVFNYTVAAGNTSADLDYAATTSLALNSGTIKDSASNNATLTLASPGATNSLGANKNIVIDTTAPTLAEVTAVTTPTNDTTPDYTFSTTEAGTISYGGDCSSATTSASSGNNTITFSTLVAGAYSNCTITVTDAVGNTSSVLSATAFTIDTTAPTVSGVTSSTANGSYKAGQSVSIQVNFSEAVTVTGTPQLTLSTGSPATTTIDYVSGSGTTSLTFTYTISAGNISADLDYASTTALALNSGTIKDAASNNATLTLASPGATNSLGANKDIVIDTTASTLAEVTAVTTPTNDTTPDYTFSTNEGGTISYGGSCSSATTAATSGNNTITFSTLSAGTYSNCTVTVTDAAGNASSALAVTSFTIDTTVPTVSGVTSSTANGSYKAGQAISVQVNFSEAVTVTGTPQLTLSTGSPATTTIDYVSGSGTTSLTFTYTVAAGNTSSDLDYAATTSLTLNGGTIKDAAGNDATLTLASPGATNSLGANKTIVIDTTAPTVVEVIPVSNPTNDTTPNYTFNTTQGGTITYGGDCSSTTTTAVSGNNAITFSALGVGTHSNCTITVTDAAGNVSVTLNVSSFTIDTTAPTVTEVTPVTTPTNDTTPSYTLNTTEAGTITYGGDCSASTTAVAGNNTVTFNTLAAGTHSNCTITVTDAAGNVSATLDISDFVIDTTGPTLNQVTAVPSLTSDTTPNYTFSSSEGGTITYGGDCSSTTTTAVSGNNTITFSVLASATHSNCTITVTDAVGNTSSVLNVSSFTVDAIAPTAAEVTPVTTPTSDTTPNYTFSTTEAGTISYGGDCSSNTTSAVSGNNAITFSTLAADAHSNCTITVTDAAGNVSAVLNISSFTIDTTAPTVTEVTPVSTPTNDTTPNYTFSTTEAGTITYGGDCSSATTTAFSGNNTITFNTLASGTHSNCTITVTDAAGNISTTLNITSFTIDAVAPILAQVTAVTTPTSDTTPDYTFSTTEAGTITYGGDCSSSTTTAVSGNNTITFSMLASGTHSNCTITVTDAAGNMSSTLNVTSFTIDTTAPTVTEVTPVSSPTQDVTPSYTFNTTEAGTITYGGDCTAAATTAVSGNNTVTFGALAEGTHSNCTITVTDAAGNLSSTLNVTSFKIQLPPPAVKFVIIDPSDTTVGTNVTVTVQAQSFSNNVVVSYQNDVTLTVSGSATVVGSNALVDINDGVGTITITDAVAESVTVSLVDTEGTGLNIDSTQSIAFAAGTLHHFTIDTIGTQTVGQPIAVSMTAQDQYGNTVTSFAGTVGISTTAGTASPSVSANFVGGLATQNVTVTQSGTGKTITVTRTGSSETGTSNAFNVNAGATSAYFLNDPGTMTTGTRIAYTVTRKDSQGNLATVGAETVRLYTSSGAIAQFYDAAVGGNAVTSITISNGQSSANFWYYDDNVGTWTVTVSDAVGAPDGATGIADATDSVDVAAEPIVASKFIIEVASSATVGATVPVTVKAVNASNQLDTTYNRLNNSIFLHSTGSSTANSGIAFTVVNGIGTINVTDTVAETVTLSLQDLIPGATPLDASATAQLAFNPGSVHHFSIATPSTQVAGVPFDLVITAQDQYSNTATSFAGTVTLTTTAGTILPAATSTFVSGVRTESVSVTQSGTGKTITVVRSGGTEAGVTGGFMVNPGPTAAYELSNPGTMTAGTRAQYTVTRKDVNGNLVTSGDDVVRLYTTSASPAAFFDAASGGSTITQITVQTGNSTANFWYYDTNEGTWTVTVSENGSAPDGTTGIDDATDSIPVDAAPIAATKFLIYSQASASTSDQVIITVKAVDANSNVDTTYSQDVTFTVSGAATIVGDNALVNIASGVGTITITDATTETITLGLNDTESTGLDVSHTRAIVFSSGGGTSTPPANVNIFIAESTPPGSISVSFSGKAFPKGRANAFVIGAGNIPIKQNNTANDGRFALDFSTKLDGARFYGVFVTDDKGRISQAKIFTVAEAAAILEVKDILFSPTIDIERDSISKGDFVVVSGSATPGSTIELEIDGKLVGVKAITNTAGVYRMLYNTGAYGYGTHSARVRQITTKRETSDFSVLKAFALVDYRIQPGDINRDGDVDARDGSIFLALWSATDPVARKRIDLNGDGKVDVKDFSIFIRTIQGRH